MTKMTDLQYRAFQQLQTAREQGFFSVDEQEAIEARQGLYTWLVTHFDMGWELLEAFASVMPHPDGGQRAVLVFDFDDGTKDVDEMLAGVQQALGADYACMTLAEYAEQVPEAPGLDVFEGLGDGDFMLPDGSTDDFLTDFAS